jgi:hypothetical protein
VSLLYKTYAYIEKRNRKESRGQTETILTDRDKAQERIRPDRNNNKGVTADFVFHRFSGFS